MDDSFVEICRSLSVERNTTHNNLKVKALEAINIQNACKKGIKDLKVQKRVRMAKSKDSAVGLHTHIATTKGNKTGRRIKVKPTASLK